MSDFKNQIDEDIREYQAEHYTEERLKKDEWAFNYWILDKFFYVDEKFIKDQITDYKDDGIDAYVYYEETNELYLIQNKYFSETTSLDYHYVEKKFLQSIHILEQGIYNRSKELQAIFTKNLKKSNFVVKLQLYITNNMKCSKAEDAITNFNVEHAPKYEAEIFYLDDIKNKYFGEPKQQKKTLSVTLESLNNGTMLNYDIDNYEGLKNKIKARYVLCPVISIFNMYEKAIRQHYQLFDMNIREYLGNKGINKRIKETLEDSKERENFFFYNNGITLICDKIGSVHTENGKSVFRIDNPQIVNGCQTVNSIYQALNVVDDNLLQEDYAHTHVLLKVLEIRQNEKELKELYQNIVRCNNSQNKIDEKAFVANSSEFQRLQDSLKRKGFLLLIKQSDKNTFLKEDKSELKKKCIKDLEKFGLVEHFKKINDYYIPLDKLLQAIIAFIGGGYDAYQKKAYALKLGSTYNRKIIEFITTVTIDTLLNLWLLYKRSEVEQKASDDNRYPNPYYLVDAFALYECENRNDALISTKLTDSQVINRILYLYKMTIMNYAVAIKLEYNVMIKQKIDYDKLREQRNMSLGNLKMFQQMSKISQESFDFMK